MTINNTSHQRLNRMISQVVNSDFRGLAKAEHLVRRIKSICNYREEDYVLMITAVTEAMNNAILHGNKNDSSKPVCIKAVYDKYQCEWVIEDKGEGFDYHGVKDPTSPENIIDEGGRGIFIMKQLASNVEFLKNGRCVKLAFTLPVH